MITYMDTLHVTPGMPVFLSGEGHFDDMVGTVDSVNTEHDWIVVKWDHPNMSTGTLFYDAAHFQDTTDRDGNRWLILDL